MNKSEHDAPTDWIKNIDEHGNEMPLLYRIPFNGKDEYFYTGNTYRLMDVKRDEMREEIERLKSALSDMATAYTKVSAERDQLRAEVKEANDKLAVSNE